MLANIETKNNNFFEIFHNFIAHHTGLDISAEDLQLATKQFIRPNEFKYLSFWANEEKGVCYLKDFRQDVTHHYDTKSGASDFTVAAKLKKTKCISLKLTTQEDAEFIYSVGHEQNKNYYCARKQVDKHPLTKVDDFGNLIVPLYTSGCKPDEPLAVQTIYHWKKTSNKKFTGPVKGTFFPIEGNLDTVYVCEGYATGMSIHMATGASVLCAMSCGNLSEVVGHAIDSQQYNQVIIAADNDSKSLKNTGLETAKKVAAKYSVGYVFPEEIKGTDFNDFHVENSLTALKRFLEENVKYIEKKEKENKIAVEYHDPINGACFDQVSRLLDKKKTILRIVWGNHYVLHPDGNFDIFQLKGLSKEEKKTLEKITSKDESIIEGVVYAPGKEKLFFKEDKKYLNSYTAPYIPDDSVVFPSNILEPFFWLLNKLYNRKTEHIEFIQNWLAHLVKYPGTPLQIAPIIVSEEKGIGKGLLLNIAANLVGSQNSAKLTSEQFFDSKQFNSIFFQKVLVYVEESSWGFKNYEFVKDIITSTRGEMEQKGVDKVSRLTTASYFFTSNTPGRIYIDKDERRFAAYFWEKDPQDKMSKEEGKVFADKNLSNPERDGETPFIHALRRYLLKRVVERGFNEVPACFANSLRDMRQEITLNGDQRIVERVVLERNRGCFTIKEVYDWLKNERVYLNDSKVSAVLSYLGYEKRRVRCGDDLPRLWVKKDHLEKSPTELASIYFGKNI